MNSNNDQSREFRVRVKARARRYGAVDWKIFPIAPSVKNPPLVKWSTEASNDDAQIERWWTQHPDANIGVACGLSGIAVIDIDVKAGKRGGVTLDRLEVFDGVILPATRYSRTPSGGFHYFYKDPLGQMPSTQNVIGRHLWEDGISHIDTKGRGGYVLLPCSRIAAVEDRPGGYYRWHDSKVPIAPLPQEIIDLCASVAGSNEAQDQAPVVEYDQPNSVAWAVHFLKDAAPIAIEGAGGERQTLLIAGTLKDRGISEGTAVELMLEHYSPRCDPPWSLDELTVKIANAYLYLRQNKPGDRTPEADFDDVPYVESEAQGKRDAELLRKHAREAEGFVRVFGMEIPIVRTPKPKRGPKGKFQS